MKPEVIVAAAIVGGAIIIATGLSIYFSPYHTCLRTYEASMQSVEWMCAMVLGGRQ